MKKVKVFIESSMYAFELAINRFIDRHRVTDIQFSPTSDEHGHTTYNAMIVYEE